MDGMSRGMKWKRGLSSLKPDPVRSRLRAADGRKGHAKSPRDALSQRLARPCSLPGPPILDGGEDAGLDGAGHGDGGEHLAATAVGGLAALPA